MKSNFEQHCADESLDLYALGRLDEAGTESLEVHILVCQGCRMRLDAADRYVQAMKSGAARLREEQTRKVRTAASVWKVFQFPTPAWAGALVAVLCTIAVLTIATQKRAGDTDNSVPIALVAERGESLSAPARHALDLSLDARGLELGAQAWVELVDGAGSVIEQSKLPVIKDQVRLRTPGTLRAGSYFVRLYRLRTNELSREFSLQLTHPAA